MKHRVLNTVAYTETLARMRAFTDARSADTDDELWALEHPPVYTLGQAGRQEHVLDPGDIPLVQSDRGGQVTYHGPGQLIVYTLVDLRRAGYGIRDMVVRLENAVVSILSDRGIEASGNRDAPGVYVDGAKIAALGLRVRRGCTFHGLSLNVNMDLAPFAGINPCGFAGQPVTSLASLGCDDRVDTITAPVLLALTQHLSLA